MKFLTPLLLLVATVCFGATPDYKAFRGTGGILVTTNPPIGTIVIDGSNITSPTGGVSAATATNIAIAIFNQYSSTNGLTERTNVLYIECGDTDFLSKISNCPNNTVMVVGPCPQGYAFSTWAFSSNNIATPFSLVNKTNVEIQGLGMPAFKSSQTPFGETMMISNCSGVTIRGIRLESLRVTNIASMPSAFTFNWAALKFINVEHLLIENCEVINHHNHGIVDGGGHNGNIAGVRVSTNDIVIRNNYFRNGGSFFPTVPTYDGAAISITGGLVEGNNIYEWVAGIEPFSSDLGTNLFTKITRNYLENILVSGIQDGGMGLHFYGVEISQNTLRQTVGYTRGGTNFLDYSYGIKTTAIGNVKITENTIINQQGEAILLQPGSRASSFAVDNNFILNATNHIGYGTGVGIVLYSASPLYNSSFRGNVIINAAYGAMAFSDVGGNAGGLKDSVIENNTMICPNTVNGPAIVFFAPASNVTVRANFIRDTNATPTMWHGIHITTNIHKRILCYDNIIEGGQTGAGNFQIFNEADDKNEVAVNGTWPLGPTNVVSLVSGRYTNNVWDRLVGIPGATTTIGRTNLLPSAAKYFRWPITIFDKGTNASGTNLWIATVDSQTINGGPTITNIATDNGSMTLVSDGANWRILNVASSGVAGGGNFSTNANGAAVFGSNVVASGVIQTAFGFLDSTFAGDLALVSDPNGLIAEEPLVGVLELQTLDGIGTTPIITQLSNKVRVTAGANVTVTPSGSGGIMSYAVASTAGGGNFSTNANGSGTFSSNVVSAGVVQAGFGFLDTSFAGDFALISDPAGRIAEEPLVGLLELQTLDGIGSTPIITQLSNKVKVAAGAGVTVTASGSGGIMTYTVASTNVDLPGVGFERFYDDAHTEYFQLEAPFDIQTNNVVRALSNATAGVLVIKGVGTGTNQMLAIPEGTGMFTNNGAGVYGWMAIPSGGGGATSLTNLLDVVATNMQSGDALTYLSGMNKWTNVAPFITYNLTINSTNVFVGSNLEHNVYINTNSSFKMVFTGTPLLEETLNISISNYLNATIYVTNTFYDTTVASNVLYWAIAPLSERKITLVNMTNHSLGVARWELRDTLGKEYELAVAGGLVMLTNAANSTVTISNGVSSGPMTRTNFVMNQIYTNTSTSPILVNASAFLVAAAVNGGSALDLMYSPTGGISYVLVARSAMSTVVTGFAVQVTNSIAGVITNAGNYYFTNTSSGAGNSAGLVAESGQVTVLGGSAGPSGVVSVSTVFGAGTDYSLTASFANVVFGTTSPSILLPSAGTYEVSATVQVVAGASAGDYYYAYLYNSTDAAYFGIAPGVRLTAAYEASIYVSEFITITSAKTVTVRCQNQSAARGTIYSPGTKISYRKY